jgi:hypothetical protein
MSTAEPFIPAETPRESPTAHEHDVDGDTDVLPEQGVTDPDAESAPVEEPKATFRTPTPGARLTAEELEDDVDGS